MKKVKINRSDLELSFELGNDETTAYLDTEGSTVVFVEDDTVCHLESLDTDEAKLEGMGVAIQTHADVSCRPNRMGRCQSISPHSQIRLTAELLWYAGVHLGAG